MAWRTVVAVADLAALAGAAAYEVAVALRWIAIGDDPGSGAPGAGAVEALGVVALLIGLVVSVASIRRPAALPATVQRLMPLVGATLVVATGLGFDPYYAPSHVRYPSNGGVPATSWLGFVAFVAVCAVVLGLIHAPTGMVVTAVLLLLCLGTFVLTGSGH